MTISGGRDEQLCLAVVKKLHVSIYPDKHKLLGRLTVSMAIADYRMS